MTEHKALVASTASSLLTESHGLDLDAIRRKLGTHSIFGPSGAAMWALCSGSLIPNLLADDDASEDAAYGTTGHMVGEVWGKNIVACVSYGMEIDDELIDSQRPTELVGTIFQVVEGSGRTFDIEIDDEMLAYVREYIVWCVALAGDHYVEQRVDISPVTPIPNQSGTADWFVIQRRKVVVTDLKMGRERVYAEWNFQGLLYALGVFYRWDWAYHFEEIEIRIAQPRLDHWDVFTVSREQLLAFAEWIKERAALAWAPNALRTPGPKQCRWCKVAGDCAANAAWLADRDLEYWDDDSDAMALSGRDDIVVGPDGVIHGVSYTVQDTAMVNEIIERGSLELVTPDPNRLSTLALEKLLLHRKRLERFFTQMQEELLSRAEAGADLEYWKLVPGRAGHRKHRDEKDSAHFMSRWGVREEDIYPKKIASPAQLEEAMRKVGYRKKDAVELIDSLVNRPESRSTLVEMKDDRKALPPPADLFDDLDAVDEL